MRKKLLLGGTFAAFLGAVAWAQSPGVNSPFNPVWSIPLDSIKRTYSQQIMNLSAPAAGLGTDVFQICGSASVTTKISRIIIAGRATAAQSFDVVLVKRSAVNQSGTVPNGFPYGGLSQVGIAYDVSDAASQANVTPYTVSPTQLGAAVGNIAVAQVFFGNLTTGQPGPPQVFDFGNRPAKSPTLRSATQCLNVNLSAQTLPGAVIDITAEWTEE